MQDPKKIEEIRGLLESMIGDNHVYSDLNAKTYYDYDKVLKLLREASETITESVRTPRPDNLPEDIPWSEKFANPDQEFDPFVIDGSMSPKDYEKMVSNFDADREAGVVDDHGQEIGDTKIRYFDVHGKFTEEITPFYEKQLPEKIKEATTRVNTDPRLAGWEAFSYDHKARVWGTCKKNGEEIRYDTGRRGDHVAYSAVHRPPEMM